MLITVVEKDIVTTIEPNPGFRKTLNDVQKAYSSEGVGGIVIDPRPVLYCNRFIHLRLTPMI